MPLTFATKRRRRFLRWRTLVILIVVAAVVGGVLFFAGRRGDSTPPLPTAETDAFVKAWSEGNTETMAALLDAPPPDLKTVATSLVAALPGNRAAYRTTGVVRTLDKKGATATYHARVDIAGFGPVEWDGTLTYVRTKVNKKDVWRIHWTPDVLYPGLAAGQHLTVTKKWPARASILAADGALLAGTSSIISIGLEPDRIKDLDQIKIALRTFVGTDAATIDAALSAPGVQPQYFVPIAWVPDDARYRDVLKPQLEPIPGVFFQRGKGVLGSSRGLVQQVVGSVGEITADRLKQLGAPYAVGDKVGLTGVQSTYEKQLAGAPSADVVIVASRKPVRTVKKFAGRAAQPVRLTIDPRIQQAAEGALAGVAQPAALLAIDAATGQIRAAVSKPDGGFNRAFEGTYPPGSTFKVVTSAALLANGRTATTPAPCPPAITVNGRTFHNFEGESGGALDLARAFAISCNNAFIGLADQLPENAMTSAAQSFGFNAKWSLPIRSAGGSYPAPKDGAELAASAIGQGRVLASPVQMASVAGAVAAGGWRAPVLTTQPKPTVPKVPALSASVVSTLRAFMASVPAAGGTAAGAGLPPGTFGKTGTAEFGNDNPPHTHAWFIGYRNGLAFAVIVEDGGVGGRVAAPLAARFLNAVG